MQDMGEKQGRDECNVITEIKDWPQKTWSDQ